MSKRTVGVGEPLSFQASSTPASVSVAFTFDHGDGTLDPGRRSDAFYTRNGQYRVRLQWVAENGDGEVDCQTVTVLDDNGCHISLGPADGLGWRCGSTWCPANPLQPASGCPTVAPHGCYIGQDGQPYCIDEGGPSPTPTPVPQRVTDVGCSISPSGPVEVGQALVFQASALPTGVPISFVFAHGDGTLDPGARSDAYYTAPGSYAVQVQWTGETQSGVVDCGTVVVVASQPDTFNLTCTILDSEILVGQITEFRAEVSGQAPALSFAFLHGDGTRDARAVSQAFYNAPGVYAVTLEWATDGASGTMDCGSVTVS